MKKNLKPYFCLPLLLVASYLAYPQQPTASNLTGLVLDENQQPLPYATVTLHLQRDSAIAKIGVSDENGGFTLVGLPAGDYFVQVAAVGYASYASETLPVESAATTRLPPIILKAHAGTLETVDVVAAQPLIEMKADRTVVNVGQLLGAQGRSAWELLQQAPGVMASGNGSVAIHGIENVLVIIDGKQTHLSGNELAEHLQSLPADQIHQVEVVSRPSAKYDAAGIGGVINLRTKKGLADGFNGSFTVGARQGRYFNSTNSLETSWKKDKVYAFANLSYALGNPLIQFDQRHTYKDALGAAETIVTQHFVSESTTSTPTIRTGLDYTAGATSWGVAYHANLKGFPAQQNTSFSEILNPQQQLLATNEATRTRQLRNPTHNISAFLDQQLGKAGASLSVVADYLHYRRPLRYHLNNTLVPAGPAPETNHTRIQQDIPSEIGVYGIKASYRVPLSAAATLEAGVKSTRMEMENDAVFGILNPATSQYETDEARSTHYFFNEQISAAYVDYSRHGSGKWGLQAGLRLEYTHNNGQEMRHNDAFQNRQAHLFPSVLVQYRPSPSHGFGISYNRRINRPNYEFLIPFAFYTDLLYHQAGNPRLAPEISGSLSLSHTFANQLSTSLSYTRSRDPFLVTLARQPGNPALAMSFGNIDKLDTYSLNISYMKPVFAWYSLMANLTAMHRHYTGELHGEYLDAGRATGIGQLTNQFRFPRSWALELSAAYTTSAQDGPFSISDPMSWVNITVSKQVLNKQGSLRFQIIDLFDKYQYDNRSSLAALDSWKQQRLDSRMVGLSFSYRFGKGQRQARPQLESATTEEAARL